MCLCYHRVNVTNHYHAFTVGNISDEPELQANFSMEIELLKDPDQRKEVVADSDDCEVITPAASLKKSNTGSSRKRRNVATKDGTPEGSNSANKKLAFVKQEKK